MQGTEAKRHLNSIHTIRPEQENDFKMQFEPAIENMISNDIISVDVIIAILQLNY